MVCVIRWTLMLLALMCSKRNLLLLVVHYYSRWCSIIDLRFVKTWKPLTWIKWVDIPRHTIVAHEMLWNRHSTLRRVNIIIYRAATWAYGIMTHMALQTVSRKITSTIRLCQHIKQCHADSGREHHIILTSKRRIFEWNPRTYKNIWETCVPRWVSIIS